MNENGSVKSALLQLNIIPMTKTLTLATLATDHDLGRIKT